MCLFYVQKWTFWFLCESVKPSTFFVFIYFSINPRVYTTWEFATIVPKKILHKQFWTWTEKCQRVIPVNSLVLRGKRKWQAVGEVQQKRNQRTDCRYWFKLWHTHAEEYTLVTVIPNSWIDQAIIYTDC